MKPAVRRSPRLSEIGDRSIEVANSGQRWTRRRGWRIEIDGGVGEASPLPGVSPETHAEVGAALGEFLRGGDPRLPASAAFAIDTAQLDARARREHTSIAALLGARADATAAGSQLGFDPPASCACAKLKVGPAPAWPAQRARIDGLVERRPDLRIRLDFNGSLTAAEAAEIAVEIAAAGWPLDFVEDPSPVDELRPLPVPLAVDAAVTTARGLERAVAAGASVAVIKPALVGGLRTAVDLAATYASAGIAPIASHLLDGPIALAACAELACALGGDLAHGVGLHPGLGAYEPTSIDQIDGPILRPRRGGLC